MVLIVWFLVYGALASFLLVVVFCGFSPSIQYGLIILCKEWAYLGEVVL